MTTDLVIIGPSGRIDLRLEGMIEASCATGVNVAWLRLDVLKCEGCWSSGGAWHKVTARASAWQMLWLHVWLAFRRGDAVTARAG